MSAPLPSLHTITQPLTEAQIGLHAAALSDLQGNILKSHGRHHAAHVFLKFKAGAEANVKAWITKKLKPRLTTALRQIQDAAAHRATQKDGGVFTAFLLTASGYTYLGRDPARLDQTFNAGIVASAGNLGDPTPNTWEFGGQKGNIDAMVLLADTRPANVRFLAKELEIELNGLADVVHTEFGDQRRNERGDGIEHFGYVDGRSQPLFFSSDLDGESDGTSVWDPTAGPALVLVADPFGAPGACGSYFVFRKLEQHVKAFKTREQVLANALALVGEKRELAGALVVGRFEDGTPVTMFDELIVETSDQPNQGAVPNNFDYSTDAAGARCPFHAHIRKSNPRGSGPGGLADENSRRMARRGITYGARKDDGSDIDDMPDDGVGLLFMAYQRDIAAQFEFIQRRWVNDPAFPQNSGGTGIDPIIGQGAAAPTQDWPKTWNAPANGKLPFDFAGFVAMKGGEYFFAPSPSSL